MKKTCIILTLLLLGSIAAVGQTGPRFTVEVSNDSILVGNVFKVSFTLKNADGSNFGPPELRNFFEVVAGPNMSSSVHMMNGQMNQSISYTYYLRPLNEGAYYIEPASIETPEAILETEPIEVLVLPNPNGFTPDQEELRSPGNAFPGFEDLPGMDLFNGMEGFPNDFFQGFDNMDGFFKMLPEGFQQMGPDSLFFNMPPNMNFFQMDPDSLFKNMPEQWKQLFPDGLQPSGQKKKKRKIYKI